MDSQGSAYAENEKYLDSIQGRIDLFTNSLQTMWMNFIDSDVLKFIVDLGTAALKLVDNLGLLPTVIGGFAAFKSAAKEIKTEFEEINKAIRDTKIAKDGENPVVESIQEEIQARENNSNAIKEEKIQTDELTTSKTLGTAAGWKDVIATNAQIVKTKALAVAKGLLKGVLKGVVVMLAAKAIGAAFSAIYKGIDNVIHRAEKIKEEVTDLKKTYEDAKKTFDDNLTTLTTSSDTSVYATLQDEFNALTKGVDKYGNNISLTSDQYERYKSICEKIVGIQPSIAAGYDSATKAIGQNASVLSELIELQKIQARQNVEQLISDENFGKIVEDAKNDYKNINTQSGTSTNEAYSNAWNVLSPIVSEKLPKYYTSSGRRMTTDANFNGTSEDEIASYILEQIGYTAEEAQKIAAKYYNQYNKYFNIGQFMTDYSDVIKANTEKFGEDYKLTLDNTFYDIEQAIVSAGEDVKEAQDGLVDDFLLVPQGEKAGKYYDQLNDASKKFITDWIKNGSQFKIDQNQTKEAAIANRDKIIEMVKEIASEDFKLDFEGQQITGQDFLDKLYDLDATNINWGEYKVKAQAMLDEFWNQIGGDENEFGATKADLKLAFGLEFINDESREDRTMYETRSQISEIIDKSETEIQDWLDTLPPAKVKKFYEIDWNKVDNSNIKSFGDLEDEIDKQIVSSDVLSVKTYSDLSDAIENFNEIQSQTEEIVANNTEVTQDYKDSLTQLGIAQEDLNDCFDKGNPLLVKNAALLRKLIAQKKAEKQATVQAAKAQTQMQYKNTVNQLKQVVSAMQAEYKANGMVSNSTLKTVGVLRSQLTALKQTIQQYALLELKLTDAANAYDEFEAAKNRDAELSYGDSMIEMLEVINEGFKTGKVGSEAFQAAVKALVPESVYKDIDDLEARMIAIHDYIDKNPVFADYFTVDDDGNFSITYDNMKAFIQDGLVDGVSEEFGVFTGSLEDFNLSDNIQSVKDLADAYGITEAAALAMISTFEQYDASWGNILTELTTKPLDRQINKATDSLDEALAAQEAFIRSGGDLNSDEYKQICANVEQATTNLNTATTAAKNNAQQWTQLETVYAAATGKISLTQEAADSLARSLGIIDENGNPTLTVDDNGTLQLTQEQVDLLNGKVKKLEEPSIMQVQLQYDEIVSQIDELKAYRDKELTEDDRNEIKMKFGLQEGSDAEIDAKIAELTKERETITLKYNITQTISEQETGAIEKLQDWETNGMTFSVNAQTEEAKDKIDELNTEKDKLSEPETTTYIVDGTGESTVQSINDYWTRIVGDKSTTYTVYENKIVTESTTDTANAPSSSSVGSGRPRVDGTAHAQGYWGATKTETALTGELGPEILVRNGHWTTIGENGAEFTQIKKGDIIFNHKQTEELLKNGYVTGRGKMVGGAFANGTINKSSGPTYYGMVDPYVGNDIVFKNGSDEWVEANTDAADKISGAADDISDAADEFREVFDWIEVRLEEIDEKLSLLDAKKENETYYNGKNNIIDQMIDINNTKMKNLAAGIDEYTKYANKFLSEIPEAYRQAAQDGSIAITEFAGETDEATVEAINNYREWAQKAADLAQQLEETKTTIRDLAIEKFNNAYDAGSVRATVEDSQTKKLQNAVDLINERGEIAAAAYYGINGGNAENSTGMFESAYKKIQYLTEARIAMQKELDDAVKAGQIIRGSNEWYELIDQMYQVQSEIDEATIELEQFQNAINDLYWDNFDELINRLGYLQNETQNLIDLMDSADMVTKPEGRTYDGGTVKFWTADDVQWTEEGIASLGLYAQQMEIAEYTAKQYAEAIKDLQKDYAAGKYSENEYLEKLNELKDAQYENIEAYYDACDSIKELNKIRIESIKTGIEAEISAYEELIEKKKEELYTEKD